MRLMPFPHLILRMKEDTQTYMKRAITLVIVVFMVFSLASCGSIGGEENKVKTVGIAMPSRTLERWNRDGEYLETEFKNAGYEVELVYSDNDVIQQKYDIGNLIKKGVDILIVAAVDSEEIARELADAKKSGIPVIAYDRLFLNADAVSYCVSFDNYAVGALQGQFVVNALDLSNAGDRTYNIEFTAGDPRDNNARYFFNGAFDVLKPYIEAGTLNVVSGQMTFEQTATAQWNTSDALVRMNKILETYYSDGTELDVALCSNDATALGVTQAIAYKYKGENSPIITGQDGDIANLRNIVDGIQNMTVYKNVANEAVVTLELAKSVLAGKQPAEELIERLGIECEYDTVSSEDGRDSVPVYLLVPHVITVDNLQDLVDTGLYKWDGDYLASTVE